MSSSVTSALTASSSAFSGVSKFATSLQQVLTRAVGIASLPLHLSQEQLTTLTSTQTALQSLEAKFSGVQISLGNIQSAVTSGLLSASVADSSIASASLQSGSTAGTYSLEVDDLGAYSTALSVAGSTAVTDPATQGITGAPTLELTLAAGGTPITITPASASLRDLASAINSQAGGQVQATLVNIGSTNSPDYRLSLQSAKLSTGTLGLTDSLGADLVATATAGAPASYIVNGSPPIASDTRNITLSTGLTVSLLGQSASGVATTITVRSDPSALASAFSSFATAYNSATDAIATERGKGAGPLSGDSTLLTLSSALAQLGTYNNGSAANSLATFGITLEVTGHLSVDTSKFATVASANFTGLLSTLGGTDTGGFLQTASTVLAGVNDPAIGALTTEEASVAQQITAQKALIANEQATVTQLQTNLTAQIAKADAALAQLESQVSYVTGLFAQYTGANNTQSNGLGTL